jgi:hypothetical protein
MIAIAAGETVAQRADTASIEPRGERKILP